MYLRITQNGTSIHPSLFYKKILQFRFKFLNFTAQILTLNFYHSNLTLFGMLHSDRGCSTLSSFFEALLPFSASSFCLLLFWTLHSLSFFHLILNTYYISHSLSLSHTFVQSNFHYLLSEEIFSKISKRMLNPPKVLIRLIEYSSKKKLSSLER